MCLKIRKTPSFRKWLKTKDLPYVPIDQIADLMIIKRVEYRLEMIKREKYRLAKKGKFRCDYECEECPLDCACKYCSGAEDDEKDLCGSCDGENIKIPNERF